MKRFLSRLAGYGAMCLTLGALAGCPSAVLQVTPGAVDFGSSTQANIRIANVGQGTLSWTITELSRTAADATWTETDVPWLSAEQTNGAINGGGLQTVRLNADTANLPATTLSNIGIRVTSNGGAADVPLSITIQPTLTVTPTVLNLGPNATQGNFTVSNTGNDAAAWTLRFLPNADDISNTQPLPSQIIATPAAFSTEPNTSTAVTLTWPQGQTNFALLVQSNAGNTVVRFNFGSVLSSLAVRPSPLRLYYNNEPSGEGTVEQVASNLEIENLTGSAVAWTLEVNNRNNPSLAAPITLSTPSGSTPGLQSSTVQVSVSSTVPPANVATGTGNYELLLRSGDAFIVVPISIELQSLPVIAASEPPNNSPGERPEILPIDLLDLGRENSVGEFWIANIGPRGSRLNFEITHEDQNVDNPLLASVQPLRGRPATTGDDFYFPGENYLIDGIPIRVVVDRNALTEDVEFRTLTIRAYDDDYQLELEPVEEKTVQIRVERAPLTIEGAINRSRPPFLMRFVFLLRDSLGNVIPTLSDDTLDRLTFNISEEEQALDVNETNFFVQGPEGIKTNLVLMLDYTGSMLNAGTDDDTNPLQRGDAIAQIKAAARSFIKDLPEGYRLQLMYHADRQQRNRLIHPFSSDINSITAALDAFALPESLSGVTTIRDAVVDAIAALAVEDGADTLPFDEADVRSVVFITDGLDNASLLGESEVINVADEARVRLYPLVYGLSEVNGLGNMIPLAEDTGGHTYFARSVEELAGFLANRNSIELSSLPSVSNNQLRFSVDSGQVNNQVWNIETLSGNFIDGIEPANSIGQRLTNVNVTLNPADLPLDTPAVAQLRVNTITPDTEDGTVTITATPTLVDGIPTFLPENVALTFRDPYGKVWNEITNQLVMTYVTPLQDSGNYNIGVAYEETPTRTVAGNFEEDGVFAPGDIFAGQLALVSAGIVQEPSAADPADRARAEVFLRADYIPRDVTSFRVRFILTPPVNPPAGAAAALAQAVVDVTLAPDGLLIPDDEFAPTWRLLPEGDGIFRIRTEESNDLLYGSFGNLLRINIRNLEAYTALFAGSPRAAQFDMGMRIDNDEYFLPAGGGLPSRTKYFLYPGGPAFFNPEGPQPSNLLTVELNAADLAGPAPNVLALQSPGYDPELAFPWDLDGDGVGDFQDPEPLNEAIPSALVIPNSFEIGPTVNQFNLTIRNNRLDTFTWSINEATLPSWIPAGNIAVATGPGPLAPGQSDTITITVDRTGLSDVVLADVLEIETDTFGTEEVELTLVAPPAP